MFSCLKRSLTGLFILALLLVAGRLNAFAATQQTPSSEEQLAAALVAAPTDEQRTALLSQSPQLINRELRLVLQRQAQRLQTEGDLPRLLSVARLMLQVAQQADDKIGLVRATSTLGIAHHLRAEFDKAQSFYEQAAQLAQQYGDQRGSALILRNQGQLAFKQARLPQAIEYYQRSLQTLASETTDEDQRRDQLVSSLQSSLAEVFFRTGDYTAAQQRYERGLTHAKQINYAEGMAQALFGLGTLNRFLGNCEMAQQSLEESLRLTRRTGLRDKEAAALNNLGAAYTECGNYRAALDCLRQSLELKESLRDPSRLTTTLNNIGLLYQYQGDDELAIDYYQRSLQAAQAARQPFRAAYVLNNLGYLHGLRGRYQDALQFLEQSIRQGDPETVAQSRNNLGQIYLAQEKFAEAARCFEQSLEWSRTAGNRRIEIISTSLRSDAAFATGDFVKALESAERAVQLAREVNQPEILQQSLTSLARIYRAQQQPQKARAALVEAIAVIETIRDQTAGGIREQQQVLAERVNAWQQMVSLLLAERCDAEAFEYAERAKARSLLDVLRSGRVNITSSMSAAELAEERRLQNELTALNTSLYRIRANATANPKQEKTLSELSERLRRAQRDLTEFQAKLYAAHPELQARRGQWPAFTYTQAGKLLSDQETALLEYAVTPDRIVLFVVTATNAGQPMMKVYELASERKETERLAKEFREQLAQHDLTFKPAAARLYQMLLKPAAAQLSGKTKLLIVPDAGLWELPFQALVDEAGRYLIEGFSIAYAPSLTSLAAIKQTRNTQHPASELKLLAFGNPSLGNGGASESALRSSLKSVDSPLRPLSSAETEVTSLARLYGSQHSRVYVGTEAREERIKATSVNARVLHIAAHGVLNDANPMYSQIVLAQPASQNSAQSSLEEDGLLETWEIMKLNLHVDVAVLSACETARGRIGAGEGMIGLSWAFFIAGTPVTVVSQWKVEADSTATLMREFHRHLQTKSHGTITPAAALREAALKLLRSPQYRHPLYWASFVAVGDAM